MYSDRKNLQTTRYDLQAGSAHGSMSITSACASIVALFVSVTIVVLVLAALGQPPTLFEDGSWIWGELSGCLPWAICAIP